MRMTRGVGLVLVVAVFAVTAAVARADTRTVDGITWTYGISNGYPGQQPLILLTFSP